MDITTSVARHYAVRLVILAVVCLVFAVWGAYDLWVKIPNKELRVQRYHELMEQMGAWEQQTQNGGMLTAEDAVAFEKALAELALIAPGGKTPAAPGKFDRLTQWFFISCGLCVPYFLWRLASMRRRVYELKADGTLVVPEGAVTPAEIAEIDMSTWMAKSVATVVLQDGRRIKLDDYYYQGMNQIVGRLASDRYPDQWDAEAKPIKADSVEVEPDGPPTADPADLAAAEETPAHGNSSVGADRA